MLAEVGFGTASARPEGSAHPAKAPARHRPAASLANLTNLPFPPRRWASNDSHHHDGVRRRSGVKKGLEADLVPACGQAVMTPGRPRGQRHSGAALPTRTAAAVLLRARGPGVDERVGGRARSLE
ncbi:hypothetical protein GCM10010492_63130 [Saccharothrix mutabilis subsp. mutabilis]|uniref:Uncharacterized protein n=1 Tax=Saccharothrix mutabilis subsp. mutabilis TaxID=66855 RepID=A0ABP3E650_9PSEU